MLWGYRSVQCAPRNRNSVLVYYSVMCMCAVCTLLCVCLCVCVDVPEWTGPVRDGLKWNPNEANGAPGPPGSSIPAGVTVQDR